jgi:hypothetical protein
MDLAVDQFPDAPRALPQWRYVLEPVPRAVLSTPSHAPSHKVGRGRSAPDRRAHALNVALPVLPLHRSAPAWRYPGGVDWPSEDLLDDVHGIDGDLACAILGVPLVDLANLIESHLFPWARPAQRAGHGTGPDTESGGATAFVRATGGLRSSIHLCGVADRVVKVHSQVLQLWEHWDRPALHWYTVGTWSSFARRLSGASWRTPSRVAA